MTVLFLTGIVRFRKIRAKEDLFLIFAQHLGFDFM